MKEIAVDLPLSGRSRPLALSFSETWLEPKLIDHRRILLSAPRAPATLPKLTGWYAAAGRGPIPPPGIDTETGFPLMRNRADLAAVCDVALSRTLIVPFMSTKP
ncbi:hypothetical protein HMPREF0043_00509 [Actinobaculum sp. oral taxon 183 str. F0552]|nr:hypothetical protein HMPREF0043_00509 [Actinobaculum sp. oral taxon 183 str. F0552]